MGSSENFLEPQSLPICATEARFCLPHNVRLRLGGKKSGHHFKICDAADESEVYFQCEGRSWSLHEKRFLFDNKGVPVLNMKEKILSFSDTFRVFAGDCSEREICSFRTKLNFMKVKFSTKFVDAIKEGCVHHLVMKGDWRNKRCVIFLGEPKKGGIPIARIFRPFSGRTKLLSVDDYVLEVASGVDIAICVIMCIALDEHVTK